VLSQSELAQVDQACRAIADEACDENGFVSIDRLLKRFQAKLLIRPLLVEGMIAAVDESSGGSSSSKWLVLVDSETYAVNEQDVASEAWKKPLPARFRNTVAHELAHSLAFRPSEFGIRLRSPVRSEDDKQKIVQAIEKETERLSPLLLWPDKAVNQFLRGKREALTVTELVRVATDMGFSRPVLINRLAGLHSNQSELLQSPGLQNLAVGLGDWVEKEQGVLRSWPLFLNFDRNLVPGFLRRLRHQDRMPGAEVYADRSFALLGGSLPSVLFEIDVGTDVAPGIKSLSVEMQVEARSPNARQFLFVLRATQNSA
jgi:hypothetical protein